jgi:hypothetical protein
MDFSNGLASGETLQGTIATTSTTIAGTDLAPSDILNGSAAFDPTNKKVQVPVKLGVDGCDYLIKVVAQTSNAQKVLSLSAILPVRS